MYLRDRCLDESPDTPRGMATLRQKSTSKGVALHHWESWEVMPE